MKNKLILLMVIAGLSSTVAHAASVGGGTTVRGHSSSGSIATPSNVGKAVDLVNKKVFQEHDATRDKIVEIGTAQMIQQQKLTEGTIQALRELFVSSTAAEASIEDAKRYGPQNRSKAEDNCNHLRTALAASTGKTNAKALTKQLEKWRAARSGRHSDTGGVVREMMQTLDFLEEEEKNDTSISQVKTKEQIEQAVLLDEIIINPIPFSATSSSPSPFAKTLNDIKQRELDVARKSLDDLRAYDEAPSINAESAPIIDPQSIDLDPLLFKSADGSMSEKSLMDFNVASRYNSAAWKESLIGKHETVYLQEITQMLSISLEQGRRQNELLSSLVKLASYQFSVRVREAKRGELLVDMLDNQN